MDTTLYYTLSTISQTLGGALGLVGAFVVYFLADLDRRIGAILGRVEHDYLRTRDAESIEELLSRADYTAAIDKARRASLSTPPYLSLLHQADATTKRKANLLARTKVAVVTSIVVMALVVAGLCLVPLLGCVAPWVLAAAWVAFVVALVSLGAVVWELWSN